MIGFDDTPSLILGGCPPRTIGSVRSGPRFPWGQTLVEVYTVFVTGPPLAEFYHGRVLRNVGGTQSGSWTFYARFNSEWRSVKNVFSDR